MEKARMYHYIRGFFYDKNVLEVHTPILSNWAATSPHVKPMKLENLDGINYLHTSPEFAMKKILAKGVCDIYQICSVFRDGDKGSLHRNEFSMLEWYRKDFSYYDLMSEAVELISGYLEIFEVEKITYREAFKQYLNIDPYTIDLESLKEITKENFASQISLSNDDYLGLCFSKYIEPCFKGKKIWIVYDYPASQSEYANIKRDIYGNDVSMRFEIYVDGVELANGYDELTCHIEQEKRMLNELQQSGASLSIDKELIRALKDGIPKCSGIALGIDRLLMLK